ncbi:hypothetical protein [Phosphitispora fastidiosa]|uniref:hypothetical protein n=1 Tax=Phosphitispora fastidiosa TaxID=2837202 RepID=UPI001E339574|nr:sugar lactone lactonase YvrE [Phosphitispora fastidiosa]
MEHGFPKNEFYKKAAAAGILIIVITLLGWSMYSGPKRTVNLKHRQRGPDEKPVYLGSIDLTGPSGQGREPVWVYVYDDLIYVSYFGEERIEVLTPEGEKVRDFRAKITKADGRPEGMVQTGDRLLAADYHNGGVGLYAESGRLLDAYYETPDKRRIKPVGVTARDRVFYITDVNINGWFTAGEDGVFLTEIKGDTEEDGLQFPYGIAVTDDGRVIVTDPPGNRIRVFNCAGWNMGDLPTSEVGMKNPQGLAIDVLGRIHVVDNGTGRVFVYDNEGNFMFTYGQGLLNPTTIGADSAGRILYLADTGNGRLSVWGY